MAEQSFTVKNTITAKGVEIDPSSPSSGHTLRHNGTKFISTTLIISDLSGMGTGVATALTVNVGSTGAIIVNGGALGTPTSGNFSSGTFTWPTFNQNTTGSAASLSISGQTGLLTFAGLTTTNRTKTIRDAADTILELGGSYTPIGTWNWTSATATWPTFNQNTTGSAASLSISGQTGLLTFAGLTATNRAKTVRDAADTILELGGSYTPTGTWNWTSATATWPTFNQNTTGTASNVTGTVAIANGGTGSTSAPQAMANLRGYTTTATAAGTTTLTNASTTFQRFTGTTTQTIVLPVTSTLQTGWKFDIENSSTGILTINSSGGNLVTTVAPGATASFVCIGTTLTTAADWDFSLQGFASAPQGMAVLTGYTSTATAAGTTTLTNTSSYYQQFTGTSTQIVSLPVTSTLQTGWTFHIVNNSTGVVTVNSSGGNLVITVPPKTTAMATCIGTTLTTAADWESGITDFSNYTGYGGAVLSDGFTSFTPLLTASTTNPSLGNNGTQEGRFIQVGKMIYAFFNITFGTTGSPSAGSGQYRVSLPYLVTTVTGTSGQSTITVGSPIGLMIDMTVTGTGIGTNAKITAISGTTVTLSVANSGTVSGNGNFYFTAQTTVATFGQNAIVELFDSSTSIFNLAASQILTATTAILVNHSTIANLSGVTNAVPWTWAASDIIRGTLIYETTVSNP